MFRILLLSLVFLGISATQADAAKPETWKLFCEHSQVVNYWATFDSGTQDKDACDIAALFFTVYLNKHHPKTTCWCSSVIST